MTVPPRILPALDDVNRAFWTGGADGRLVLERCDACDHWQHPPTGTCEQCGGTTSLAPASGRGTVFTYTVNHQQYHPEVAPPYVIAIVELDEQPDLRIVANLVDCPESELRIGLPVEVGFEAHGEHQVPVFAPV